MSNNYSQTGGLSSYLINMAPHLSLLRDRSLSDTDRLRFYTEDKWLNTKNPLMRHRVGKVLRQLDTPTSPFGGVFSAEALVSLLASMETPDGRLDIPLGREASGTLFDRESAASAASPPRNDAAAEAAATEAEAVADANPDDAEARLVAQQAAAAEAERVAEVYVGKITYESLETRAENKLHQFEIFTEHGNIVNNVNMTNVEKLAALHGLIQRIDGSPNKDKGKGEDDADLLDILGDAGKILHSKLLNGLNPTEANEFLAWVKDDPNDLGEAIKFYEDQLAERAKATGGWSGYGGGFKLPGARKSGLGDVLRRTEKHLPALKRLGKQIFSGGSSGADYAAQELLSSLRQEESNMQHASQMYGGGW